MKVMRIQLMYKQGRKEIVRLVHPNAVLSIKTGGQVISDRVINTVTAFFSMYILCFALTGFALSAAGLDYVTAFLTTQVLTTQQNGFCHLQCCSGDLNSLLYWYFSPPHSGETNRCNSYINKKGCKLQPFLFLHHAKRLLIERRFTKMLYEKVIHDCTIFFTIRSTISFDSCLNTFIKLR